MRILQNGSNNDIVKAENERGKAMIELGILLVVGVVTFMIFARGEGAEGQSEMTVSDVDGAFKEKGWD